MSHGLIVVQARAIFKSEVSRITSSGLRFQQIDSLEGCWYSGHIYVQGILLLAVAGP